MMSWIRWYLTPPPRPTRGLGAWIGDGPHWAHMGRMAALFAAAGLVYSVGRLAVERWAPAVNDEMRLAIESLKELVEVLKKP